MAGNAAKQVVDSVFKNFRGRTKRSKQYYKEAVEVMPGGSSRAATHYKPYPVFMVEGNGCKLYDCDGNKYIDFHNNYTSLIHGHAHPPTVKAAQEQLYKGTVRGAPSGIVIEHAKMLKSRMPSLELVRYCNSGNEASQFIIRAARAFTGKDILVKTDGSYHGSHDTVDVNVWSVPGPVVPEPRLESRGVSDSVLDRVAIVPFNSLSAMEETLTKHKGNVAAVIVEPLMNAAGEIPPRPGYLAGLREMCNRHNVLLIFDEVVTFRLSKGGMQEIENVQADLIILGKIIGGGFPVGALGGRKDIMSLFDENVPNFLFQSGTFNANDITMAAGIATVQSYQEPEIDRVNRLGERMRQGLNASFKSAGIVGQATGMGSLATIHWRGGDIVTARDAALGASRSADLYQLLHLEMMNRGIFFPRRGQLSISTALTEQHVEKLIVEFSATLDLLQPYISEVTPHLLDS